MTQLENLFSKISAEVKNKNFVINQNQSAVAIDHIVAITDKTPLISNQTVHSSTYDESIRNIQNCEKTGTCKTILVEYIKKYNILQNDYFGKLSKLQKEKEMFSNSEQSHLGEINDARKIINDLLKLATEYNKNLNLNIEFVGANVPLITDEIKNTNIKSVMKSMFDKLSDLKKELSGQILATRDCETSKNNFGEEIKNLTRTLQQCDEEKKQLIKENSAQINTLKQQLNDSDNKYNADIKSLDNKLKDVTAQYTKLNTENKNKLIEQIGEITLLKKELGDRGTIIAQLQSEINKLTLTNNELNDKNTNGDKTNTELLAKNQQLELEITNIREQLSLANTKHADEMANKIRECNDSAKLHAELIDVSQKYKNKILDLQNRLHEKHIQFKNLNKIINKQNDDLLITQIAVGNLQKTGQNIINELEAANAKLTSQLAAATSQLTVATSQLIAANKQNAQLTAANAQLTAANRQLSAQIQPTQIQPAQIQPAQIQFTDDTESTYYDGSCRGTELSRRLLAIDDDANTLENKIGREKLFKVYTIMMKNLAKRGNMGANIVTEKYSPDLLSKYAQNIGEFLDKQIKTKSVINKYLEWYCENPEKNYLIEITDL